MTQVQQINEEELQAQLTQLTTEIRNMEDNLIRTKEGYLKVQGALEGLTILKQREEEEIKINEACQLKPIVDEDFISPGGD